MGLFDLTDLTLERALQGSSLRQQLLAGNLANVNTAGFKRSDVDFQSALASAIDSGEPIALNDVSFQPTTDNATSLRPDGNNVDVDREIASLTENAVTSEALSAIAKSRLQMIQTAMGGR
jgi:flagellar basal-body rod protein FlgB